MKTLKSIWVYIVTKLASIWADFRAKTPIFCHWVQISIVGFLTWIHTTGEQVKDVLDQIKIPHLFGLTAYHVTIAAGTALAVSAQAQVKSPTENK